MMMRQTCTRYCWMLLVLMAISCDPFFDDQIAADKVVTIDPSKTECFIPIETSSSVSVVINLNELVTSTFETISLEVAQEPRYGSVSPLGNSFLKYTSSPTFYADTYNNENGVNKDRFSVSIIRERKVIATQDITVTMGNFPCSLYAVEDEIATAPGTPVSVTAIYNDRVCDIRIDDVELSIALAPQHGHAEVEGITITYTPEAGYDGADEFVYRVTAPGQENIAPESALASYGLVTVNIDD